MKHIDDLLPGVVAGIIDRYGQDNPKHGESKPEEKARTAAERELDKMKSLFE